jgi:hypothetical protein
MGCSGGLTLAIRVAVKAFLATEGTPSVGNNMMAPAGGEGGSGAGSSQPPEPVVPFPMGRAPMIGYREIYLFSFFSFSLLP